jgi:HSF-type DNA-binding
LIEACSKDAPRVCSWTDDGKTFTVFDIDQFEMKQVPLFFKHSKFSSFVRQLNFYSLYVKENDGGGRIGLCGSTGSSEFSVEKFSGPLTLFMLSF